ncbi:MAG: peptidase M28 family protein [Ignavibacteria bacterium]
MQCKHLVIGFSLVVLPSTLAQQHTVHDKDAPELIARYAPLVKQLVDTGLTHVGAYAMLEQLTTQAPHRLSGSEGAAVAVALTKKMMEERGFENVHLEKVMVPRWVRGEEECWIIPQATHMPQLMRLQTLDVCALGGSVATPDTGLQAEVVEVKSFDELRALGQRVRGKIVFFNRPMDPTKLNTFEAYSGAVDQRSRGAIEAARFGAVAALVRSMTLAIDDKPHTGAMNYADSVRKIPGAAISTLHAHQLSEYLKRNPSLRLHLKLTPKTLLDVESANVVGELRGSEKPNEIIVVGGHLDAWDKGQGAHDDGAGCVQAIEALHLLKKIGVKTKRTIRAVMFMNEENGLRGGRAYPLAPERKGETHIAAIESDAGGHTPRGFSVAGDSLLLHRVLQWQALFDMLDAGRIRPGYAGVDISPLVNAGVAGFGLVPENHRYFDYHHSDNDTIDKVHPRELEMGAIVEALLCYLISEEGLMSTSPR